ncbi:MAG: hypothetical protein IPM29_04225 [Planctomycetes bacterium]|nr:hypothetical protein [Planctomycetota bacterium]
MLPGAGIDGPFGLILGPSARRELLAATAHGDPVGELLGHALIDGPIPRDAAGDDVTAVSPRGGDHALRQPAAAGADRRIDFRDSIPLPPRS